MLLTYLKENKPVKNPIDCFNFLTEALGWKHYLISMNLNIPRNVSWKILWKIKSTTGNIENTEWLVRIHMI